MSQAYGHSHHSQFIGLPCCTAAQTTPVPNVALRSLRNAAIECFLGRLGQLFPLPQVPVSHNLTSGGSLFNVLHTNTNNATSPWLAGRGGAVCWRTLVLVPLCPPCSHTRSTAPSRKRSNVRCDMTHPLQQSHHSALSPQHLSSTKTRGFWGVRCFPTPLGIRTTDDTP